MLGQDKGKWGLLLGAAACLGVLAFSPVGGAAPSPSVARIQADDVNLATKSRAAVLDLYSLDARLSTAEQRLATLQADSRQLVTERLALVHQLQLARVDTRISQIRLASRLRFIYDHGEPTSLDVVMGAKSLQDAMTQLDDYNRVASVNTQVLIQVHLAQRQMIHLRQTLRTRERTLAATTLAASQTVAELQQLEGDRIAYIGQLQTQQSLDAARIAQLNAEAQAAVARSETLVTPAATEVVAAAPTVSPDMPAVASAASEPGSSGVHSLTVSATCYDLKGHTATGLPVGWGIAAVDPAVIPLGTHIVVPGYGVAVAADTGPAIVGDTIDLWFPTDAQCSSWGRRTVTIDVG